MSLYFVLFSVVMGCGDIQMTFWSLAWDLMAHGVLGHRVFCWHLVGSFQHPYHIIRECTYTCDIQWKCYSCCILGTFIGTPFCSIALDRISELLDCTQRHHLKESKDTHENNNSKNKPIINNCQWYTIWGSRKTALEKCAELCCLSYWFFFLLKGYRLDQQNDFLCTWQEH